MTPKAEQGPQTSGGNELHRLKVEVTGAGAQHYVSATKFLYFRPSGSGSFTLTATASDPESGVANVSFPDLPAIPGWAGSTGGIF